MSDILRLISLGALALPPLAAATPTTHTNFKQCVQLQVPVPVVATNHHYTMIPRVDSNIDAIDWTVNVTTWSSDPASELISGPVLVNRTFSISAQLCVPSQKGDKADILQIATQGQGFDKRYWDVEIKPEEYSYVDAAVKKGYSILTYDKLGTGKSEKPDAYDIVQIPTEVEILANLTRLARSGKLISSSKVLSATGSNTTVADFIPSKIVQVGHSFGSYLITNMLTLYGDLADGAILSGFLINTQLGKINVLTYDHDFARQHDPVRFGEYGSGYFVLNTESCIQKLFFRKGAFEPEMLTYAEKNKQPETVGEYASEGQPEPAPEFKGPIQFFNGEFDNFVCVGDCRKTYLEEETKKMYPGATDIFPYLQPNTGHALTLATNASAGFEVMLQYLDSQGL